MQFMSRPPVRGVIFRVSPSFPTLPYPTKTCQFTPFTSYVLSDKSSAKAASNAGDLPRGTLLSTTSFTCGHETEEEPSQPFPEYPCSKGSACLNGDVGVYCRCYTPQLANSNEVCDKRLKNIVRGGVTMC